MYEVQAVCANGIGVVILLSLLLNLRGKYDKKKEEHFIFTLMLTVNILQCVIESCAIVLDGRMFQGSVSLCKVLNAFLYMNNIIFAILWVIYADLRLRRFSKRKTHQYALIFIPGAIIIVGAIVNIFTPIFFEVTAQNIYIRNAPWVYLPYLVTYFYLVWGTFAAYVIRRKKDKYVFLPAFTFLFPVVLGSILQLFFAGTSFLWIGAAIGLMSAYMSLQDERAAVDPLSGVFTRHYMHQYLDGLCKKAVAPVRISGIMLDIDKFKAINDQYGHLVGDEVIHKFGKILKRGVNGEGTVFRYAGDEFVVIVTNCDKEGMNRIVDSIYAELDKVNEEGNEYKIACSLGFATHVQGESPNHFLKRMDDAMYTNKNNKRRKDGGNTVMEDEELVFAGIDMPELLTRLMQNKNLVRVFIKKFLEDKTYDALRAAVKEGDAKQMEFTSHTLKGMCGNLSLKTLYSLFSEQVRLLRAGETEKASAMMSAISEEYDNSIAHMGKWLSEQD